MNSKKWKLGFCIAILFGLLNAGAGLAGDMGWKSFVAVLCASLITNLGAYLMKHPVETIEDTQVITRKDSGFAIFDYILFIAVLVLVGFLVMVAFSGCMSTVGDTKRSYVDPKLNVVVSEETHFKTRTIWDAKASANKVKNNITSTTSGTSIGEVNGESNGSNAVQVLRIVVEGAAKAIVP